MTVQFDDESDCLGAAIDRLDNLGVSSDMIDRNKPALQQGYVIIVIQRRNNDPPWTYYFPPDTRYHLVKKLIGLYNTPTH